METPAAAHPSFLKLTSTMALAGIVAAAASAQCTTPWLPGYGAPGTNHEVTASTMWDPDGAGPASSVLVVGGYFTLAGTTPASRIATYDPATGVWAALGTGMSGGGYTQVYALATLANGDLVAAGLFTDAGGVSANSIARWNGTTWSNLGSGMSGGGSVWGPTVRALVTLPNGDLIAAGEFDIAGGVSASGIARWNGTAWSPLGVGVAKPGFSAIVRGLAVLPNGDLVAGGTFTSAGVVAANQIAKWDGATWSALAGGTNGAVHELRLAPSGAVLAAGEFTLANGGAASRIARIDSSCAPTQANLGTGCTGSGGLNTLVATQLPLLGGTFRARGTGMPPLGLVLAVTGLSATALPLSVALPQALPGCTLYANPDLVDVVLPLGGEATSAIAFGATPALLGVGFWHQYVPFELDLAFNLTAVTSSNALQLTLGGF